MNLVDIEEIRAQSQAPKPPLVGVYFLFKDTELVYVGQSNNILLRVQTHTKRLDFDRYAYLSCSKDELDDLENAYILKLRPKLNRRLPGKTHNAALLGPSYPIMPGWRLKRRAIRVS
jgi:excinuclease UvrABC nuclease subunit